MFNRTIVFILEIFFLIQYQYGVLAFGEISTEEDMNFEKLLLSLNKQPVESFQIDRIIYDCIDIYKQPSLDHPLLKSHKIQMRPTYETKPFTEETKSRQKKGMPKLETVNCPKGTVPVQRTQKEDLIRIKKFSTSYPDDIHPQMQLFPGSHIVALKPSKTNVKYNGLRSDMTVYGLDVKDDQYSTSQLWVENGVHSNQYISLQAGWMVSPHIAGDNETRMFIYWKSGNAKTACFNHLCPGFVQVHPNLVPGLRIAPLSIYGQITIELGVAIIQDNVTGNWWLQWDFWWNRESKHFVGYWPKSILLGLDAGASVVAWGGFAVGPPYGDSPPMGNGHFPHGDYSKAAFFKDLLTLDSSNHYVIPDEHEMDTFKDNPTCYELEYPGYYENGGVNFMYGGPGGKCGT